MDFSQLAKQGLRVVETRVIEPLAELALFVSGGGVTFATPNNPGRPGREVTAEETALALAIGRAYKELDLPIEAIVGLIPRDALLLDSQNTKVLPRRLEDPTQWVEVPREGDGTRDYLHRYFVATHRDWSYRIRWHTPTPRAVWAGKLPEMMIERRWRHYVEDPNENKRHDILLHDYTTLSDEERNRHEELRIEQVANSYAWLPMKSWNLVKNLPPRRRWARAIRDRAHFPGHPEGYEIPEIARADGDKH